jgi:hypothetical protein
LIAKGLVYTQLPLSIHQFVLHDVQPTTLKEFTDHLKTILENTPPDGTMRLMISIPTVPPIQQIISHVREMKETHSQRPTTRVAVIYSPSLQLFLLNMVVRAVVRISSVQFFPRNDEKQALEWVAR